MGNYSVEVKDLKDGTKHTVYIVTGDGEYWRSALVDSSYVPDEEWEVTES